MSTSVKQHLVSLHEAASKHHSAMSSLHGALSRACGSLAKCFGKAAKEDPESEHGKHFLAMAAHHAAASQQHQDQVEFHDAQKEACAKAAEGDLAKLVPSGVSRITPDHPQFLAPSYARGSERLLVCRTNSRNCSRPMKIP